MIFRLFTQDLIERVGRGIEKNGCNGRVEKGFSLGFFDEHYLNTSNIALLRAEQGIIGFANLMPMYDYKDQISIDLMRFEPGAPSGAMDFIFLTLFEKAKEEGYR